MNKFLTKIIGASLAIAMMIGVGAGVNASKVAKPVDATAGDKAINTTFSTTADYYIKSTSSGTDYYLSGTTGGELNKNVSWGTCSTSGTFYKFKLSGSTATGSSDATITASTIIGNTTYYLKGLTTGKFNLSTSSSSLKLKSSGEIYESAGSYRLRYNHNNGSGGLRWYNGTTGSPAYFVEAPSFGTLDHVKITTQANVRTFTVGETFNSSGLVLTGYDNANEASANTQTYTSGYITDYDNHVFVAGDIGQRTVTVTYSGKTATYTIDVVAAPDFVHTYSNNSVFGSTTKDTQHTVTYTPTSGPEYITLGGYKYTTDQTMSLANLTGMYFGNNEEFELNSVKKNIDKIVITTNSDVHDKVVMTEGPIALSEDATVEAQLSNSNKTLTYEFSGNNPFFKFKNISSSYINMTNIKVFLGTNAVVATVTEVLAGIKEGTYMTGSTLSASDFDVFVSWSNGNVTEPTSGFTWTVRGIANGTLNEGNNEVIVTYQGVPSDPFNVVGTSIHATAVTIEEEGPIALVPNGTLTLHGAVVPNNAIESIVWSSDDENIASVTDAGVVTANALGVTTITATAGSVSTSRQIIVSNPTSADYSLVGLSNSNNAYASMYTHTFGDGQQWKIPGNQTIAGGLKIGGKLASATDRFLYSISEYESVSKITITHGAKDSQITSVVLKLYVFNSAADAAEGDTSKAIETVARDYAADSAITFEPATQDAKWLNKYFRIVYTMTSSAPSNNYGLILTRLTLGIVNPSNKLENTSSIKTISGVESNGGATVENVALRFGGIIPVSDWNAINSNWPITDYGVMFARGSMLTARSLETLEAVFRNDADDVAMVHRGSVGTPNANGDNYVFTARLNLEEADYDEVFYAAPFIVAGGEYYFLPEMHYSVRTLAEECYNNGGSSLSQAALATLKGNN